MATRNASLMEQAHAITQYGEMGYLKLSYGIFEIIVVAICIPLFIREQEQPMIKFRSWTIDLWASFALAVSTIIDAILSMNNWVTHEEAEFLILSYFINILIFLPKLMATFLKHYFLLQVPIAQMALLDQKVMLDPVLYTAARKRLERVKFLSTETAAWIFYIPNAIAMAAAVYVSWYVTDMDDFFVGNMTTLLVTVTICIVIQIVAGAIYLALYIRNAPKDNFFIKKQFVGKMIVVTLSMPLLIAREFFSDHDIRNTTSIISSTVRLMLVLYMTVLPLFLVYSQTRYRSRQTSIASRSKMMVDNPVKSGSRSVNDPRVVDGGTGSNNRLSVANRSETPSSRKSVHLNLPAILQDPVLSTTFRTYLAREFSMESLLFIEAVKLYKTKVVKKSPEAALDDISKVFSEFIAPSAVNEVNLPKKVVDKVKRAIETIKTNDINNPAFIPHINIFDESAEHIEAMLIVNHLRKFQTSQLFKDAVTGCYEAA